MAKTALGMASRDGIVYSFWATDTDTYMYRQNAYTGDLLDTAEWLSSAGVLLTWTDQSVSFNTQMAIGKDKIGIVTQNGVDGIQIRIITRSTGATSSTTVINSNTATAQCTDICADASDNFYVAWQLTGTSRLSKYNSAGTLGWTLTGSTKVWGCAYDRVRSKLQIVGEALGGGANSVADIDPSDGSLDDGANVASTPWFSIQADGRMGWLIGKADTVARITGDGEYTVTWSRTVTGFSGYKLGAADGSQTASYLAPSGRVTRLIGVSDGTVVSFDRFGTVPVTSGTNALARRRPVVFAAQLGTKLYFADGDNTKLYNAVTNTMATWTASAGTFPVANSTQYPRLIENWRGRIMLSGIVGDPDNVFAAKQDDPTDFNTAATDDQAAFAFNSTEGLGRPPDIVNTMIPISDDNLVIGCDHLTMIVSGDPRHGGRMDLLSNEVGMVWGRPWCRDPWGVTYFMSSRGHVHRLTRTGGINQTSLSRPIDRILEDIDFANTIVRMAFDVVERGMYLILTPLATNLPTRHFFYDGQGWFPDRFRKTDHNPRVVYLFDGDDTNDRVLLAGCNDGYVRYFEQGAWDDDGQPVESYCYVGPWKDALLKELRLFMPQDEGFVNWSVHVGESAEAALRSTATLDGLSAPGRNHSQPARRHGHSVYLKLYNDQLSNHWTIDRLEAAVMGSGRVRRRAF